MKEHIPIKTTEALEPNHLHELYRQLGGRTPLGFYRYYFNELPFQKTNTECFNHVNEIYFELFGEYRYEDYDSFRKQYNRHLRQ